MKGLSSVSSIQGVGFGLHCVSGSADYGSNWNEGWITASAIEEGVGFGCNCVAVSVSSLSGPEFLEKLVLVGLVVEIHDGVDYVDISISNIMVKHSRVSWNDNYHNSFKKFQFNILNKNKLEIIYLTL